MTLFLHRCWWLKASVTNYTRVFIVNFEHYLHMKLSILFSIVFIKQIFQISWSFNSHFFIVLWLQQLCKILKATARQREKSFFFRKLLFLTFSSSTSKVYYYAIGLKFSAKQINLITTKSVSAICEIMNINAVGFLRTLVIEYFWKKHESTNKIKTKFFFENRGRECYDLDMCQNSKKTIDVWWSWSSWKFFWGGLKTTWLLGPRILWILNNPRFNNWFKGQRDGKISNFCQVN